MLKLLFFFFFVAITVMHNPTHSFLSSPRFRGAKDIHRARPSFRWGILAPPLLREQAISRSSS